MSEVSIDANLHDRQRPQRWPTPGTWAQVVAVVVVLTSALVLVCLRTANTWDEAPVCRPGESGRCVTELSGELTHRSVVTCTADGSCSDMELDLTFTGGLSRHLVIHQGDRISGPLGGGQRNFHVVPRSGAPVIGRFFGTHLVELVFPSAGSRLATDDYPGSATNDIAQIALISCPIVLFLSVLLIGWRLRAHGIRESIAS